MPEGVKVLDVMNAALQLCGVQQAADPAEQKANTDICRTFYRTVYSRTLRRVPWGFARFDARLEQSDDEDPLTDSGTYLYDLPGDFERLWVWGDALTPKGTILSGTWLRSACPPELPVTYLRSATLAQVNDTFVDLLQVALAAKIKPRFSKGRVSAESFSQQSLNAMERAMRREAWAEELKQSDNSGMQDVTTFGRDPYTRILGQFGRDGRW